MSSLGSIDLPDTSLLWATPNHFAGSGTFFYDRTTLYAYAGIVAPEPKITDQLWSFDTTDDTWARRKVRGGSLSFGNVTEGVHASDPSTGTSFYTGGWDEPFDKLDIRNGTLKFLSFNSKSPQWSFERRVNGDMQGPWIAKGSSMYLLSYVLNKGFHGA